ncbi:sensor histidine kinase [Phytohabitans sp. ZYX-F-186]|uniref:histidine kinase n=1 Tax=Phytohabitans maris TaxID=3071409 RepID=A0ABU0ZW20_9ACTN|nr:sensor histidine kinase [Phytohabitans sp. ZYX-F-186]MDQ7911236.1 sensor histidine kinase [Phytohabitans sp. ZYX-F-186]
MRAGRGVVHPLVAAGVLLAAVVLPCKAADAEHSVGESVFTGVSGLLFLGAGAVAHHRRPDNRVGLLMVLVGLGWFAEDVRFVPFPLTHTLGLMLSTASSGFLAHLVLAFPAGRLGSRPLRWLVGTAYVAVFGLTPFGALFQDVSGIGPAYQRNLLHVDSPAMLSAVSTSVAAIGAVVAGAVVVVLVRRWVRATPPQRRLLGPVLLTFLVGGLASAAGNAFNQFDPVRLGALTVYQVAFCVLPLVFLAGVLRVRLGRTAVAELLIDLQRPLSPAQLRDRLATALGDRTLQIGYWRPDAGELVDAAGAPLARPAPGSGRAVTYVDRAGERVAALIHDEALREDGHVLRAVTAAAGLTLDNQRLTAEVRAQLGEVRASRARIVTAITEERRRMERDLHDGVQQHVVAAAIGIRAVESQLGPEAGDGVRVLLRACGEGLDTALSDLRSLARGIHPAILSEDGLVAALQSLVERVPAPVELVAAEIPRLPPAVEATAYFVVAEAVTNAVKHAQADRIRVTVLPDPGGIRVAVDDDGTGGAAVASGSGLLGLADRVRALDGDLVVRSESGRGTTVCAVLPARA